MSTNSHSNPAIAHCLEARNQAMEQKRPAGADKNTIYVAGRDADRAALPPLEGTENVRAFIACVAHGALLSMFLEYEVKQLLYAAQVATSASRHPPRTATA